MILFLNKPVLYLKCYWFLNFIFLIIFYDYTKFKNNIFICFEMVFSKCHTKVHCAKQIYTRKWNGNLEAVYFQILYYSPYGWDLRNINKWAALQRWYSIYIVFEQCSTGLLNMKKKKKIKNITAKLWKRLTDSDRNAVE